MLKTKVALSAFIAVMVYIVWAGTLAHIDLIATAGAGFYAPTTGSTVQLGTLCTYNDGSQDNCSGVTLTWGSIDTTLMSVDSTGLATNLTGAGNTEAYAYSNNHVTGHRGVLLAPYGQSTISLVPTGFATIVQGSTIILSAANPTGGGVSEFCTWASSDLTKMTNTPRGEYTGVAAGSVNATCTIGSVVATLAVTISNPTLQLKTWYSGPGGAPANNSLNPSAVIFADGSVDVACPTTGTGTFPCRFENPMWIHTDNRGGPGPFQGGDTAIWEDQGPQAPGVPNGIPMICFAAGDGCYNTPGPFGQIVIPPGTPEHPSRILGGNYATCSQNSQLRGVNNPTGPVVDNRTHVWAQLTSGFMPLQGVQNVEIQCLDISTYLDCENSSFLSGPYVVPCPVNVIAPFLVNGFTSNIKFANVYVHGWETGISGTPGPGLIFTDFRTENEWADGTNFDDPFASATTTGEQADGFNGDHFDAIGGGASDEQDKVTSSLVRDGSGHATLNFGDLFNAGVDWIVGDNVVINKSSVTDMNGGTFPVTALATSQQVNVTGASCIPAGNGGILVVCAITTDNQPTWNPSSTLAGMGAFVQISGTTCTGTCASSGLNGFFEVYSTSTTGTPGFVINASPISRPGWNVGTAGSGGTAALVTGMTIAVSGSAVTATTPGVVYHVIRQHRTFDQQDGGAANGDGFGAGDNTTGIYICVHCLFAYDSQDCYDALHGSLRSSTYSYSIAFGCEGGSVKVGNADSLTYTNDLMIGNGAVMLAHDPNRPVDFNQYISMVFRANATIGSATAPWSVTNISSNSTISAASNIWTNNCTYPIGCKALPSVGIFIAQNNTFACYTDVNNPAGAATPVIYDADGGGDTNSPNWSWMNNNDYQCRGEPWTDPSNQTNVNPLITLMIPDIASFADEVNAINWSLVPLSGSPLFGAGLANAYTPTDDINGVARPNPPSIGAYDRITAVIRHLFPGIHH